MTAVSIHHSQRYWLPGHEPLPDVVGRNRARPLTEYFNIGIFSTLDIEAYGSLFVSHQTSDDSPSNALGSLSNGDSLSDIYKTQKRKLRAMQKTSLPIPTSLPMATRLPDETYLPKVQSSSCQKSPWLPLALAENRLNKALASLTNAK
ncbi:hypothetical protein L3X38_042530 [Prunus dulcis]|uniref:Uncharacterized protein n=1 Tax=Prunus dulcis TaxID=3755 RepID=A0AAD4YLB3_PRUDU|nr:hypothetical protein L3X38_042530 [Prunus dulcis]